MDFFIWLEQSGLGVWINQSDSIFAYPSILLLHTVGLTLLVGLNIVIDLRILGFAPQIPVAPMQKFFPLMWTGLAINTATGLLLLTAKATTMIINPAFYVKIASIALAVGTFFAIKSSVFGDPLLESKPIQTNGKMLAFVSIILWLCAITAGRMMAYVGEAAQFGSLILR